MRNHESIIKFHTIKFLNGTKHISEVQVESLCHLICHQLNIEKTEDSFKVIREACSLYYALQIKID